MIEKVRAMPWAESIEVVYADGRREVFGPGDGAIPLREEGGWVVLFEADVAGPRGPDLPSAAPMA